MKALTVRQPWAQAIADGTKLIENRSQGFPKKYRGPLLIHAGKGWSERGGRDDRIRSSFSGPWLYAVKHVPAYHGRPPHPFSASAILAIAEVADIHPASGCCAPWGEETYAPANPEARPPGRVTHLVLEDIHRLQHPVAANGALGLWTPDADLLAAVEAQQ